MDRYTDGGPISKVLLKQKLINKDFNSQIAFQPNQCATTYTAPVYVKNPNGLKLSNIGKSLYFTCVVFERKEWKQDGVPFFMVIKVAVENK